MSDRDLLADARASLAGACASTDHDARVVYCARARALLLQLRTEIEAFSHELDGVEREIVRVAKINEGKT
jgi:hypothetical protein